MEDSDKKKEPNDEILSSIKPKFKVIFQECKVCGAPALHSNYGAVTCSPCKIFFKRNTTIKNKQFTCNFDGHCEINVTNRHICTACRLAKCFACGMQTELIRCPLPKKNLPNKTSNTFTATSNILITTNEQHQLPTSNLLQADTSILTTNQWTLLLSLIKSYDETKLVLLAHQLINEYSDTESTENNYVPLLKDFFIKIYQTTGAYICSNDGFCTLSPDDRSAFLRNIAENVTCFGTAVCWNQSQIYNCKSFVDSYINFYGENSLIMIQQVLKFIDKDIDTAKLALSLFAFSNNISIFSSNMILKPFNTLAIFRIQNNYVEIMWKYLVYKYGYYQSIKKFMNLLQCLFIATNTVFDAQNIEKHISDIESLVEQTELALVLDDIERVEENKN